MKTISSGVGRLLLMVAFVLFLILSPTVAKSEELEAQKDGIVEKVIIKTPDIESEPATSFFWQTEIQKIGSSYLRLRITDIRGINDHKITFELRDRGGHRLREYSEKDLEKRATFWTAVIPGDYVLVTLFANQPPAGFSLTIDRIAYQAYAGAPLSTWGEDEKESIANYASDPMISAVQRSVARLLFIKDGSPRTCTGFLIDSGRLMTNHHCISSQQTCDTAVAVFGYQYDSNGLLSIGEQFDCARVVPGKVDYDLDYAILELNGNAPEKWGKLDLNSLEPQVGHPLYIVQHPGGQPKQISKINCDALSIPVDGRSTATDFAHTCDTIGGSSGSPVFNAAGKVIGLHHYGFGTGGEWEENRAIRMSRILDKLGNND